MATIRKRGDSYSIRVSCGYDTNGKHKEQAMTWKPEPGMTKRQIEKELQRQARFLKNQLLTATRQRLSSFRNLQRNGLRNMQSSIFAVPPMSE